jgi:DNA relaxase NicK
LAIDVDFDLSAYQFIPIGSSREKSTVEYRDPSRQLETLYIGKRESDKMIRLYNKKVEQAKKGNFVDQRNWWRLKYSSRKN